MVPVFKNVGERSKAKNCRPVSLAYVVSKALEKRGSSRLVDYLEKCGLFSDFQYGFRSSRSTADLLTVASDRIATAFIRSGAIRGVAIDISRLWTRFNMLVFFTTLRLIEFLVRYLALIDGFEWFWMGSLYKSIQLILDFVKAPFLVQHFSFHILILIMMLSVILLSLLLILLATLSVIRHLICGNN